MALAPRKFRTKNARSKHRRTMMVLFIAGIFLSLGLFFGAAWATNQEFMTISSVAVAGAVAIEEESVSGIAKEAMSGAYFGLFAKRSVALYPKSHIERRIARDIPRVAEANIYVEDFDRLMISVTEREPKALWCGDIVPSFFDAGAEGNADWKQAGTCYLMDETGFIFDEAPQFEGPVYARYYGALEHGEPLGQQFVPREEFHTLQIFVERSIAAGLPLAGLLIVDERDIELYLESGLRVMIPRHADFAEVQAGLLTVLNSEEFAGQTDQVEYIDLRFGNKAYYKLK